MDKEKLQIKLFIGTPCYGGMLSSDYFKSCMQLVALAASNKIELQFGTIGNESLITRARNTLVQLFMDGDYTHLLFIDADLAFNPEAVIRMLDYDKDVVTGIYPRKTIDWIKVKKRIKENPNISEDELLASSLQYNLNVKNPEKILLDKGFIEVLDGPTGFMLIKREVFDKMKKHYPEKEIYQDTLINGKLQKTKEMWNFFDTLHNPEDKTYMGEDFAFCKIWKATGGKCYAYVDDEISHVGEHTYTGRFGDELIKDK